MATPTIYDQGLVSFGALNVAGQPALVALARVTASVDPPSLTTNTAGNVTVTVAGALTGDEVIARPAATLEAGLSFYCWVSAANTVTIRFVNASAATVNGAAANWDFTLLRRVGG